MTDSHDEFKADLRAVLDDLYDFLVFKNRMYGDSALNPVRCFSKLSSLDAIRVRIDDKISRLISGQQDDDEDVVRDLFGYLALYHVAKERAGKSSRAAHSVS